MITYDENDNICLIVTSKAGTHKTRLLITNVKNTKVEFSCTKMYWDKLFRRACSDKYLESQRKEIERIVRSTMPNIPNNKVLEDVGRYMNVLAKTVSDELRKRDTSFSKELGVKYFYKAAKPSIKGFKKVCDNFPDISKKEILMIGDQLFTDIWGGNRFNINTLLVKRINKKEIWISRIKRPIERIILNHYYKKEENSQKCRV